MLEVAVSEARAEQSASSEVHRVVPLAEIEKLELDRRIHVYQGQWRREIPSQYQGNEFAQPTATVNVLSVEGGQLFAPDKATFEDIFGHVVTERPDVARQLLHAASTAKSSADHNGSPIKTLVSNYPFPGESTHQGWDEIAKEATSHHVEPVMTIQPNGLWFNRNSANRTVDGRLVMGPDETLGRQFDSMTDDQREEFGVTRESTRRPFLFLGTKQDGTTAPFVFRFNEDESYEEGITRMNEEMTNSGIESACASSPPLIIPDEDGNPHYLTLDEAVTNWSANDVRHYFYTPYNGSPLLFPELARLQGLKPHGLVQSLSGRAEDRVAIPLRETLEDTDEAALQTLLDEKGYKGRYSYDEITKTLSLNLLESVYSVLVLGVTKQGRLAVLQTSGTHGNVTGQDGPTFSQMGEILKDINTQPPYNDDPIIAAYSGCQGNDVTNVIVKNQWRGEPEELFTAATETTLPTRRTRVPRGQVTTPRVAIGVPTSLANSLQTS